MYHRSTRPRDPVEIPGNYSGSAFASYQPVPPPRRSERSSGPEEKGSPLLLPPAASDAPLRQEPTDFPAGEAEPAAPDAEDRSADGAAPRRPTVLSLFSQPFQLRLGSLGLEELLLLGLLFMLMTEDERDNEAILCLLLVLLL